MSLLSRFARKKAPEVVAVPELPKECGHMVLAPRWDSIADIGKDDKAVSFACTTCSEVFTPDAARSIVRS